MKKRLLACFAVVFGMAGGSILLFSHAATPVTNAIEPENGSIVAGAFAAADNTASGGNYVTFPISNGSVLPPAATGNAKPFSATSPFNMPTPTGTVWFDQPLLHSINPPQNNDSRRHWYVLGPFGVYYAKSTDPMWTFNLPDYIAPDWNRNRPAHVFQVHAPDNIASGVDTDKVLIVVDGTTYYEVWDSVVNTATRTVTNGSLAGWATGDIVMGPGAGTLANNDGTRAANFSWDAGLITGHDIASGKIDHALALALPADMLEGLIYKNYIAPATGFDNGGGRGPFKMGTKIGVPAGVAQPAGLSPIGAELFVALQTYGAYVGDFVGGAWPAFYRDNATISDAQVGPLYQYWDHNGSADMDKIGLLLRVANYQP